ncbi:hypothetical protein AAF712_010271 [Marasmius tenuissimus]|uniref:Uncharacterized protein n=1 Tax=Marasmius tenuissimus TaxID=585030 RepID=A0ABR2ZP80_9AGAR
MAESEPSTISLTLCGGGDPLDGCGGQFPNKVIPGLCPKYEAIKSKPEAAAAYNELPQCAGCGVVGRNLVPLFLPGPATQNPQPGHQTASGLPSASESANTLALSMGQTFSSQMLAAKRAKAGITLVGSALPTDTSTVPGEMVAFRTSKLGLRSSRRLITVSCWLGAGTKLLDFPSETRTFNAEDTMYDVKTRFLDIFNIRWQESAPGKLQGEEVYLTWPGHHSIDGEVIHGSLREVYDFYINIPGFDLKNLASLQDYTRKNFKFNSKSASVGQFLNLWLMVSARKASAPLLTD